MKEMVKKQAEIIKQNMAAIRRSNEVMERMDGLFTDAFEKEDKEKLEADYADFINGP